LLQEMLLPAGATTKTVIIMGSHDLALDLATRRLRDEQGLDFLVVPVGSLEGLVALRQGNAHLAGCHLLDTCSAEYNRPYVEHLFPEGNMCLFTLAHRQQGLLLSPGNPQQIQSLGDLTREDVTFINRNRGSGTRLWIDHHLQQLEIKPQQVQGYQQEVRTHTAVATAVLDGQASVGVGLYAAARQAGLDFIPLFQERFDLVLSQEMSQNQRLLPLLEYLRGDEFRVLLKELGGYDASQTGKIVDV
jgi:putative molybdopterin biosynthesis protein